MITKILKFFNKKNEDLDLYYSYLYGSYSQEKEKSITITKLKRKIKDNENVKYAFISTLFKKSYYPVHDLDSEEEYIRFIKNVKKYNYVIFRSSKNNDVKNDSSRQENHYWAIIDKPVKNVKEYDDFNWFTINDEIYKNYCKYYNKFFLRITYTDLDKKPIRIKKEGDNFSKNFKLFIKKFEKMIEEDSLEISGLIYKDEKLIERFNRKSKFERIIKKR